MQDTLPEGTARATQLAPSAVTASAVGGSANRSVVGRVSPTTSGSSNAAQSLAPRDYNFRTIERLNAGPGAYVIVRVDTRVQSSEFIRAYQQQTD